MVGYSAYNVGVPGVGGTLAGPSINHRTALSIAAVWNAVNIYASTIGAIDFYIAELDNRGAKQHATWHPAYDLIHSSPNDGVTSMSLRQALIGHVLTMGNGYLEICWDSRGRYPGALHLMDPREVEPIWTDEGLIYRRNGCPDLYAGDVIHIKMLSWDGIRGYSPIAFNRDNLAIPAAQRTYQSALFGNGLGMKGHLEIPGKLGDKQKGEYRDNFNKIHQGPENAGNFGILDNGAKWVQTEFSPQDAELILGCRFSVEEIARIFNLPPHKLGIMEGATNANVEQQNIQFYQQSLMPYLVAIEQEFNQKIFGPRERRTLSVRHDAATLLRGDAAAQREQEKVDLATGVRSVNEVRIARGLNPLNNPQADYHWIPVNNLAALETMGQVAPEPAITLDPDTETEEDPTLKIAPEAIEAVRSALAEPISRMLRMECKEVRKAAKSERFDVWADEFYRKHIMRMRDACGPTLDLVSLHAKNPKSTAFVVSMDWIARSRAELRDLYTVLTPEEMPAAIERLCQKWEKNRVETVVSGLIGVKS